MVELTGATLFLAAFAAFQLVLAAAMLARTPRGPARTIVGILFVLNGLVTAANAAGRARGFVLGPDWVFVFDGPTGLLFILLAAVLARAPGFDSAGWTRGAKAGLALVGLAWAGALATLALRPDLYVELGRPFFAATPLYLGYAALLVVIARRSCEAGPASEAWSALLIGFGARAAEFAWVFGPWTWNEFGLARSIEQSASAAMPIAAVIAIALVVRHMRARPTGGLARLRAPMLLAAVVFGAAESVVPGPNQYPLTQLTLVVVRPFFVGLAYEPHRTVRAIGWLGLGAGGYLVAKLLLAALIGSSFLEVGPADLAALALTAMILPLLARAVGYGGVHGPGPASDTQADAPTRAETLAAFLLASARDGRAVTQREIAAATGISPNNIAGEVRRAERLLRGHAGHGAGPMVGVRAPNVKARKLYALTPEGLRAAEQWAQRGTAGRGAPASAPPEGA